MSRHAVFALRAALVLVWAILGSVSSSYTASARQPPGAGTPHDLVNAVNALRASFGLAPYSTSAILMATAQAQADFLASTGTMTHSGPGGIGLTDRLLHAGYPLAGDLSLGGFRAENITGGDENMPPEAAVDQWTGDALHLNTMVSPYLTEIGAGVAISNGRVYYVINAARPTTAGDPPIVGTSVPGGPPVAQNISPELIIPVSVSTPNADGNVFHEVKFGQTLWQIAITYGVKIEDIKRLNNLSDNNIYPGSSLLVKQGTIAPTASRTAEPTQIVMQTLMPTLAMDLPRATIIATPEAIAGSSGVIRSMLIGIIVLAILGGGLFTWLGSYRKK